MASVGDALGAGYVASLARPGANVTGLTLVATDQSAKRLQLLKEMVPNLVRVALFWNADASGHRLQLQEMELAAPGLGMRLQVASPAHWRRNRCEAASGRAGKRAGPLHHG